MVYLIKFCFLPSVKLSKYYNNTNTDVAYINILGEKVINTYGCMLSETYKAKHTAPYYALCSEAPPTGGPARAQAHGDTTSVLHANTVQCSAKDVSMLCSVCSKQSTATLTSNPGHAEK